MHTLQAVGSYICVACIMLGLARLKAFCVEKERGKKVMFRMVVKCMVPGNIHTHPLESLIIGNSKARLQITVGYQTIVCQNSGFDRQNLSLVGHCDRAFLIQCKNFVT